MAVAIFVLFWVLLAVGLVFAAMSGRKKRGDVNTRRGGRAWWYVAFAAVLLGFGIGVPVLSALGAKENSRNIPKSDITDLSGGAEKGRNLFNKFCTQCHTLQAVKSVAQVGPNLDTLRPTKALVLDAIKNGRARGNGAMARNLVTGEDAENVAEFVAAAVGQTEEPEGN